MSLVTDTHLIEQAICPRDCCACVRQVVTIERRMGDHPTRRGPGKGKHGRLGHTGIRASRPTIMRGDLIVPSAAISQPSNS